MEPMLFLIVLIMFWTPAVFILLVALLNYKSKRLRKNLLISSLVIFLIPFLMILGSRIEGKIEISSIDGTYYGKDDQSNTIKVVIMTNNVFLIQVENCDDANKVGSWQYAREFDGFLFHLDSNKIHIGKNYKDELILESDIVTDCCNLTEVELSEK